MFFVFLSFFYAQINFTILLTTDISLADFYYKGISSFYKWYFPHHLFPSLFKILHKHQKPSYGEPILNYLPVLISRTIS